MARFGRLPYASHGHGTAGSDAILAGPGDDTTAGDNAPPHGGPLAPGTAFLHSAPRDADWDALAAKVTAYHDQTGDWGLLDKWLRHGRPYHPGDGDHHGRADFAYETVTVPGIVVTGVRSDSATTDAVVVTASDVTGSITSAALYQGSLQDLASAPASQWNVLTPVFPGQTVTSSTFYGPNTPSFDPSLGAGEVRAVGSYKYAEGPSGPNDDHGMIYQGPVNGVGGSWTQIDATSLIGKGDTLLNTIAHSTMGDLVVGNYDTSLSTGHAFIFDMTTGQWTDLNPAGSLSVTAYGIWQNDGSTSTSYTIAGGYSDLNRLGLDAGYLVDYDSGTHAFSHFTTFQFDNRPLAALISHFDGITGTADGYNLTGDFVRGATAGAFFAQVERRADDSFAGAHWTEVAYPGAAVTFTSGNTVIDDTVLGIYVADGATHSFVASATSSPPPSHDSAATDWDALAAQVLANLSVTGQWFA
ncbi:hypothetical protein [Siccirubricoccus sp. G192]|uniref:hypothetical protein n=1 Tax=Siccirubricoccus sp. G192 TaxID=2849651 RepID=UPI001C2BE806|nr:hypothetical protein [Siccirubricoccus sp. G192]MBV1795954.1 hypothetical protein [Siccirubricoccus sp. G192]